MYNRYIPQSDGSYRRSRMPEPPSSPSRQSRPPEPESFPEPEIHEACEQCPVRTSVPRHHPQDPAGSFLKNLLPHGLDTEDLLVVLLLLLMAGDCREDRNLPLLTLALYLFL